MSKTLKRVICVMLAISLLTFGACDSGKEPASSVGNKPAQSDLSSAQSDIVPQVNDYAKRTYLLTEITSYLKLDGRWATAKTGAEAGSLPCITFDHSAQLLAFNADCEGDVVLKMSNKCTDVNPGRNERYYLVVVDGKESRMSVTAVAGAEAPASLTLATGLKRGNHTFKVYRQTELNYGYDNLISLTMNGVPTARPEDSDRYIEFLGDSVTAGYGNLTVKADTDGPSSPVKSSGTDTYAFKTAKLLNADISTVARSGLAYSYGLSKNIFEYWNKISWYRPALGDYTPTRQPDVVVIALGTNDHNYYTKNGVTEKELYQMAHDLVKLVRESRPDSKIVWYYGIMGTGYEDKDGLFVKDYIKRAIEDNGGEKAGIYLCMSSFMNFKGGGWHPDAEGHEAGSKELAAFIKKIMSW